jgi:hypothetical protein
MQSVVISIDLDGTATYLLNQYTEGAFPDAGDPIRASHVEPVSLSLRLLFRALRRAFKDESRVAAWTRSWPCYWYVDMSPVGGPKRGPFSNRAQAIEFEIQMLNRFWLGRPEMIKTFC